HQVRLSTAVLLVEMMRADPELDAAERDAVVAALHGQFDLRPDEIDALLTLATQTAQSANDYFTFTSRINDAFDMEQKIEMIEHMWRVAYADGVLGAHENHLMRRMADLLYIPQGAYVHAKMRAQQG
ncbi:MAG: TerB family tellurite resistance protein, partial [Comamonadaceae bacterium]